MSLNLVQWDGSTVTPKLDAIMYDDASYGIIKGCSITHQGTNLLKIAAGYIKIAGRLIEVTEETISCQVSSSGTVSGQLWLRLDLGSITPVQIMSEAAAVLTPLTQEDDCNFTNGVYELQLATYDVDESVISNLEETAPVLEPLRTGLTASGINYDNTHSGLTATKVQGAIDEINDNLSGFKFYPTGTQIVGLIADDSAYTDEDGNYIVWGTATANQLVEDNPNTYKSVPSTEDCRGEAGADSATPFKGKIKGLQYIDSLYSMNNSYFRELGINRYKDRYLFTVSQYPANYSGILVNGSAIQRTNIGYVDAPRGASFGVTNKLLESDIITIDHNGYTFLADITILSDYPFELIHVKNSSQVITQNHKKWIGFISVNAGSYGASTLKINGSGVPNWTDLQNTGKTASFSFKDLTEYVHIGDTISETNNFGALLVGMDY
jgi:hypothetical protein